MSLFRLATYSTCLSIAALVASSEWAASHVVNAFHSQASQDEITSEIEFRQRLDIIDQKILRQLEIKEKLIAELIAGRTTLAQVATQFLVMSRHDMVWLSIVRKDYAGKTDEERAARNVIAYATAELSRGSAAREVEVLTRLEAELLSFIDLLSKNESDF